MANVWANCRTCERVTYHRVCHEDIDDESDSVYREKDTWQIVRCNGCLTYGFRREHIDFELLREDEFGTAQPTAETSLYPRSLNNHRRLPTFALPQVIRRIYQQTLSAYGEDAKVLASIGLRATIEAICSELKVSAQNLEKRIDKLFKEGHVSSADKKRLHAIRFLGNDAAHEIVEPNDADLRIALEIVENLLNSVFILEQRARRLDSIIESVDDFVQFVDRRLKSLRKEETLTLRGLLGKKYRLVGIRLDELEQALAAAISSGRFPRLKLGAIESNDGQPAQLYSLSKEDFDDDLPF